MEWILYGVIYVTDLLEIGLSYERGQTGKIALNAHNLCKKKCWAVRSTSAATWQKTATGPCSGRFDI